MAHGQKIVGPGGVALAVLLPPPGDGFSTASAKGSGRRLCRHQRQQLDGHDHHQRDGLHRRPTALDDEDRRRRPATSPVTALSETKARATTTNDTGGFVGIGDADATTSQSSTTEAYVGDSTIIGAAGDVEITATSKHTTEGNAKSKASGAIGLADAHMTSTVFYNTKADLRSSAKIVAAGNVLIETIANIPDADVRSYADGRGFGADGDAHTSYTISASGNGGDGSRGLVEVGTNAIIIARTLELKARTTDFDVYAEAKGYGSGFYGESNDGATITIKALNKVLLDAGSDITGYDGVDMIVGFSSVDTFAYSYARVTGLFGSLSSNANNTTTLNGNVVASGPSGGNPRSEVTAGPRNEDDPNLTNTSDANLESPTRTSTTSRSTSRS